MLSELTVKEKVVQSWIGHRSRLSFEYPGSAGAGPRHSLSPGACSNSCSLSQWCHPAISSSVVPFFSCPQSFPASGSFPMSQFFASGGQSIGVSASNQSFQWTRRTDLLLPGSSPGWSRVFEGETESATIYLFIKDIKSNRMRIAQ